jgi:hypothetical protein
VSDAAFEAPGALRVHAGGDRRVAARADAVPAG